MFRASFTFPLEHRYRYFSQFLKLDFAHRLGRNFQRRDKRTNDLARVENIGETARERASPQPRSFALEHAADRANFKLPADRHAVLIIAKFFRHVPGQTGPGWLINPSEHQNGHEIRRWDLSTWPRLVLFLRPGFHPRSRPLREGVEGSTHGWKTKRKQEGRNRAGVIIGDA